MSSALLLLDASSSSSRTHVDYVVHCTAISGSDSVAQERTEWAPTGPLIMICELCYQFKSSCDMLISVFPCCPMKEEFGTLGRSFLRMRQILGMPTLAIGNIEAVKISQNHDVRISLGRGNAIVEIDHQTAALSPNVIKF